MAETKKTTEKVEVEKSTLDSLIARLEELEAKSKGAFIVTNKGPKTVIPSDEWEKTKTIELIQIPGEPESAFFSVNGRTFQIMKGIEVEVPLPLADAVERVEKQKRSAFKLLKSMQTN